MAIELLFVRLLASYALDAHTVALSDPHHLARFVVLVVVGLLGDSLAPQDIEVFLASDCCVPLVEAPFAPPV